MHEKMLHNFIIKHNLNYKQNIIYVIYIYKRMYAITYQRGRNK